MSYARDMIEAVASGKKDAKDLVEAVVTKIRGGKKVKKKVRVGPKKRMSPKLKAALAKARKKSGTGAAKKARAKSMQIRQRAGL